MRSIGLYSTLLRNTLTRYNPEFAVVNAMRDVGFGATAVLDELGEKGVAKYLAHYAGAWRYPHEMSSRSSMLPASGISGSTNSRRPAARPVASMPRASTRSAATSAT